jgi:hypothetical protein
MKKENNIRIFPVFKKYCVDAFTFVMSFNSHKTFAALREIEIHNIDG